MSHITPLASRPYHPISASLQQEAAPSWREAVVLKKNAEGRLIHDEKTGKPREFTFIEDTSTGDLYNDDDRFTVAVKCAMVFIGTPLMVGGIMVWNAVKILVDIARIAYHALSKIGKICKEEGVLEGIKKSIKYFVCTMVQAVFQDIWHIVRAPIYGVGMQLCAVYGLLDPYNARKLIAGIENHWQDGISADKDVRELGEKETCHICPILWKEEKNGNVFYLAHCFQIQGNRNKADTLFLKYKT